MAVSWSFSGSGNLEDVRQQLAEAIIRDVPQDDSEQTAALAATGHRLAMCLDTMIAESNIVDGAVQGNGRFADDGTFLVSIGLSAIAPQAVAQRGSVASFPDGKVRDVGQQRT